MRVHMFGSRPRVVLTLYLKLGLNSTLDVAVRVWHFPSKGHIRTPFTGLCSGAEAKNNRRMLRWSCFTIKPLLSPVFYCSLIGYRTFSPALLDVLTAWQTKYWQQPCTVFHFTIECNKKPGTFRQVVRQIWVRAVCLDANIFQHLVRTYDVVCFISVRGHSEGSPPHDMGSQNTLDILLKWRSSLSGLLLIVEVNEFMKVKRQI